MTDTTKAHHREGSASRRAASALDAAHKACLDHPDRGPVGMSHGAFSGVNEALGIIAQLECKLAKITAERDALEKEAKACRDRFGHGWYCGFDGESIVLSG